MEWEILMTTQVEEFLDGLYETDRDSHRLVNQVILVLEQSGPSQADPWWTRSQRRTCRT